MEEFTQEEKMHNLRVQIDSVIKKVKAEKPAFTTGGREFSLVYTKLQEAKMWCGKVLEELGSELPVEFRDEAK